MAANEAARESGGPVMVAKPPSEIRGYVEGVSGNELFGWVVDPTQSDASVEVEARFDGISLGRMVASLDRPDVARAGHGAAHGFRFALPAPPEAGDHTVEVRTVHGNLAVALEKAYVVVTANGATVEGIKLRPATHTVAKPLAAPREVLLGRDGWLFEWPGLRTFHILRGADECPAQFVAAHLERVQEREAAVGDAGGTLLEAIIPSKLAVYPEHLPAGMSVDFSRRPADLVVAAARDLNTVDVVDLQAPLRHAKARDDVITRTGRGLTWTGAFAAYRSLAKQLALRIPSLEPLPREALKLGELELVADSLIALPRLGWTGAGTFSAAVGAEEEQEGEPRLEWSSLSTEYAVIEPALAELTGRDAALLRPRGAAESADATASDRAGGTALLIHDGSAARLAPFLAEHFDLTLVIVAAGDIRIEPLLTELRPTAVVEVVAEQTLLAGAERRQECSAVWRALRTCSSSRRRLSSVWRAVRSSSSRLVIRPFRYAFSRPSSSLSIRSASRSVAMK
jgi:hypothetical protein